MNYLDYWGLQDKPFEDTRNPRFFFESSRHSEALARLCYLARDGNMRFGLLTGEIGSGKTLTATMLRNYLDALGYDVIYIENADIPFNAIVTEIICELRSDATYLNIPDRYRLMREFKRLVKEPDRNNVVVILDEAQQLSMKSLAQLRNLTNVDFEERGCVTIIMVGQPELRQMVTAIPQLDQRIALRFHLRPLRCEDVDRYLRFRMSRSGHADGRIFEEAASDIISRETGGVPRTINRIARLAVDHAYAVAADRVTCDIVKKICADMKEQALLN